MGRGLVQVYWGGGKGKTTAALGQLFRFAGHNFSCIIIQFMKSGLFHNNDFDEYGEEKSARLFPNITWHRFGAKKWFIGKEKERHKEQILEGISTAKAEMKKEPDLLILDEILYCVQMKLLSEDEVIELIELKPARTELIMTGSHVPLEKIFNHADLVTEIRKTKHPFDSGILARKGPEY